MSLTSNKFHHGIKTQHVFGCLVSFVLFSWTAGL